VLDVADDANNLAPDAVAVVAFKRNALADGVFIWPMNPIIVSTIIASASFIVTILVADWLNQRHIDKLTEQLDKRLEQKRKLLQGKLDQQIKHLKDDLGQQNRSTGY
jgi:hypothetical protein